MDLFIQRVFDGLANGSIYAALALAVVLGFMTAGTLNLSIGALGMLGTYAVWWLVQDPLGLPLWLAAVIGVALGMVVAAVLERVVVRPVEGRKDHISVLIVTLGLLLALTSIAATLFSVDAVRIESLFPAGGLAVGNATLSFRSIGAIAVLLVVVLVLMLLFNRTKVGLAMRATVDNPTSSRLLGINRGRMLMFGWGLSGALAVVAGVIVAPATLVHPYMLDAPLFLGFAAAAIGGFTSLGGAILGGLILGLIEALAPAYVPFIDNQLTLLFVFAVMICVLLIRPNGLFGRPEAVRL